MGIQQAPIVVPSLSNIPSTFSATSFQQGNTAPFYSLNQKAAQQGPALLSTLPSFPSGTAGPCFLFPRLTASTCIPYFYVGFPASPISRFSVLTSTRPSSLFFSSLPKAMGVQQAPIAASSSYLPFLPAPLNSPPALQFFNNHPLLSPSAVSGYYLTNAVPVSLGLRNQILAGADINLVSLLTNTLDSVSNRVVQCAHLSVTLKTFDPDLFKTLTISEFIIALSHFRDIICEFYPDRLHELDNCMAIILDC